MKSMRSLLFLLVCVTAIISLLASGGGGGGSSSSGGSGGVPTSDVKISLDLSMNLPAAKIQTVDNSILYKVQTLLAAAINTRSVFAGIPATVKAIDFTISGSGMSTMTRTVTIAAGQTTVSETFSVPQGSQRLFLIEADDVNGSCIYAGSTTADVSANINLNLTMIDSEDYLAGASGIRAKITALMTAHSTRPYSAANIDTAREGLKTALAAMSSTLFGNNHEWNVYKCAFEVYYFAYGDNTTLNALIKKLGGDFPGENAVIQLFVPSDIVTYKEFANTDILAKINECIAYLDKVASGSTFTITHSDGLDYELDYTEVLFARAYLYQAKAIVNWALAHQWDIDAANLAKLTDDTVVDPTDRVLLTANPSLGAFISSPQSYLTAAKNAYLAAIDDVQSATTFLDAESDSQLDDIITTVIDRNHDNDWELNEKQKKLYEYGKTSLGDVELAMSGLQTVRTYECDDLYYPGEYVYPNPIDPDDILWANQCELYEETTRTNLSALFDGSISIRDLIPQEYDPIYDDLIGVPQNYFSDNQKILDVFPDSILEQSAWQASFEPWEYDVDVNGADDTGTAVSGEPAITYLETPDWSVAATVHH